MENSKGWMTLLDPTNLRQLALRKRCFDAYCPKGSVLPEIGTWVVGMAAGESDSMVGKRDRFGNQNCLMVLMSVM